MAGLYQRNVSPASANTPGMTAAASQGAAGGIPRGATTPMPRTQGQTLDVRQLGGLLGMLRNSAAGTAGAAGGNAGGQAAVSASPLAQAQGAWNNGQIGQNGALNPYAAQGRPSAGSFGPGLPLTQGTAPGSAGMGLASGAPATGTLMGGNAAFGNTAGSNAAGSNAASSLPGALAGLGSMADQALPGALSGASGTAQTLTAMPDWLRNTVGGFNG